MRYDKEHKDSLSKYPELKERMRKLSATTKRILRGSFGTRADSVTGNKDVIGGGRRCGGTPAENNAVEGNSGKQKSVANW